MIDSLEEDVRRLRDVEEIKRLKARYFRMLDTKDWVGFGAVFTEDVVMEVPEADLVESGRAAVVSAVSTALDGAQTVHHGHTPEIDITGPDSARGIWAMADYVEWIAEGGAPGAEEQRGRVGLRGYGHYVEGYRRTDAGWQIAHLRLERLRVDPLT